MDAAIALSQENKRPRFAETNDMEMFEKLGYPTNTWEYAPELATSTTSKNPNRNFWRRKTNSGPIFMFWQDEPTKFEEDVEKRQMLKRQRESDAYNQNQILKKQRLYQDGMTLNDVLPMIEDLKKNNTDLIQDQSLLNQHQEELASRWMELTDRVAHWERRVCELESQNEELRHKVDHMTNPYNKK